MPEPRLEPTIIHVGHVLQAQVEARAAAHLRVTLPRWARPAIGHQRALRALFWLRPAWRPTIDYRGGARITAKDGTIRVTQDIRVTGGRRP